jgi:PIN domain nuclease of toxin-antitoxin system
LSDHVADTHALYWHVARSNRLSVTAREVMRGADRGELRIFVPGIVLVEMIYLVERGRVDRITVDRIFRLLESGGNYIVASLDAETARALAEVPRSAVPDMPDRIIAATARQLDLPLITQDAAIHRSGAVSVVW